MSSTASARPPGAALVAHPGADLIVFMGQSATGSTIMAIGAPTLKRFPFELGGKSPVMVFADADFERAVDSVVAQIFTLNGLRCAAGFATSCRDRDLR